MLMALWRGTNTGAINAFSRDQNKICMGASAVAEGTTDPRTLEPLAWCDVFALSEDL